MRGIHYFGLLIASLCPLLVANRVYAEANQNPVVLELFTSQSCSSCPAADALIKRISEKDSSILALSYHVDYWDHLDWKDTYSSPVNTKRQQGYSSTLGSQVFTPQLVVNGLSSMVGSNENDVSAAIDKAKQRQSSFTITIKPEAGELRVHVAPLTSASGPVEFWEVRFDPYAKTEVKSGENGGRILESVNNVTSIKRIEDLSSDLKGSSVAINAPETGGVAVLAQLQGQGEILGAGVYKSSR